MTARVLPFTVGQVWSDRTCRNRQTIVAITGNKHTPIITQDEDGTVWSYRANGAWPIDSGRDPRQYDLVKLIRDVSPVELIDGLPDDDHTTVTEAHSDVSGAFK